MIIFPAIDILAGRCVRLLQGRYDAVTVYADDPPETALIWQEQGASWLHIVDLNGAAAGRPVNLEVVEKIIKKVDIPVQFGGGVRSEADIKDLFDIGVSRVVLGTTLVTDPQFAKDEIEKYGEKLVAGIDAKGGKAAVSGWQEETDVNAGDLALKFKDLGIKRIIYTDIAVDGTRKGPNIAMTKELALKVNIPIIASGGVSSLKDIENLRDLKPAIEGVIVGRALYERTFTLSEAIKVAAG